MTPPETVRAYVNTWECDENDHLNIQFYFRAFDDAAAHFFAQAGVAPRPAPLVRHVRYHRELRADDSIVGHSHGVSGEPDRLVHVIVNTATGEIAATAIDTYEAPDAAARRALEQHAAEMPEAAAPRSLKPEASPRATAGEAFEGAFSTYRGRFRPADCDRDGRPSDRAIIARVSDAATQFWTGIGLSPQVIAERNAGRVAVEMKLTRGAAGAPEALVHIMSRLNVVARSTLSFEHRIVATETDAVIATVEVTGLTLDLGTRKAIRFGDDVRAGLEARIRGGRIDGAL